MIDTLEERHLNFISQLQEKIKSIKESNIYKMDLEAMKLLEKAIFEMQLLIQDNRKLRKKIILAKSLKNVDRINAYAVAPAADKHSKP